MYFGNLPSKTEVTKMIINAIREGNVDPVSDEVWEEIERASKEPYIKMADRLDPTTGKKKTPTILELQED